MISSAKLLQDKGSTLGSIKRARSYVTFFCSIALLNPLVIKLAASSQPKYSSIITPLRMTEPGFCLLYTSDAADE